MRTLAARPARVREALGAQTARTLGPGGALSPGEHAWHAADLERERFALSEESGESHVLDAGDSDLVVAPGALSKRR